MVSFLLAVFFLLITPGPGVLSTAGVGAAFGYKPGFRYLFGLFIGTNLVALAVVSGLATIVFSMPYVRTILLVASAMYLIYLAFRIALTGSKIAFIETGRAPGVLNGIALQIVNPKAYAVNTTLFSGFAFMQSSLLLETLIKFVLINAVWIPIHILWLGAGVWLKKLNLTTRCQRGINIAMGVSLLIVVGLASKSLWHGL
ncbi:MAG: LysE family translocator [Arenicellales bacterium WSBS_2016_MAG_OTU3]